MFTKAQRSQAFIKLAITGPTGSGKTFSALRLATGLVADTGKRIAFIDTENNSASLYSDKFDFDSMNIAAPYEPEQFGKAVKAAVAGGYGVVVIDSASHFWKGILELKDKLDGRSGTNAFANWKLADAKFDPVVAEILHSQIHVICCMRSKMDYVLEEKNGKQTPRKVGMAPIMREGIEYEFTTVFDVSLNHEAMTTKDRSGLFTDKIFQITEETGKEIVGWLSTATAQPPPTPPLSDVRLIENMTVTKVEPKTTTDDKKRPYVLVTLANNEVAFTWDAALGHKAATIGDKPCNVTARAKGDRLELLAIEEVKP